MSRSFRPISWWLATIVAFAGLAADREASLCADEGLPAAVLEPVKAASAFVKVKTGPLEVNGSAFVFKVDGDALWLATNAHVVAKPKVDDAGLPPGARMIMRFELMQLMRAIERATPEVKLVFRSGTPDEEIVAAQVVAADSEKDVAILRATGVKKPPQPISIDENPPTLTETQPVYVFGFPFGSALGVADANPAISVGKGSLSSVRKNDKGETVTIQIDGAVNPGNSGGAVVDAQGKLVGVATATIRGAGIGLAIPPSEIKRSLESRASKLSVLYHRLNNDPPQWLFEGTVVDPFQKVQSLELHYVAGTPDAAAFQSAGGKISGLPGAGKVPLTREGMTTKAGVTGPTEGALAVSFQTVLTTVDGKTILGEVQTVDKMPTILVQKRGGSTSVNRTGLSAYVPGSKQPDAPATEGSSPAKSREPEVVEIEVLSEGKWWPVNIIQANSERYYVRYKALDSDGKEWVTRDRVRFPTWDSAEPDKKIEVRQGKWWWPALVVEKDGERTKVHFPGWSPKHDEWVDASRIRQPQVQVVARTWTDSTGKHKVEATFVKLVDGKVTLKTTAGKNITMALEKLSAEDKAEAERLAKEIGENPFE